jgi:riboflavin kinase/FMN adenylyltransferase
MRIRRELEGLGLDGGTAVTIGVFDGVHLGHQSLLSRLKEIAGRRGLSSVVLTFRNHPASVLRAGFEPRYLTVPRERVHLLQGTGVHLVVQATFDAALSRLGARTFAGLLRDTLDMRVLAAGPDFAMGRNRQGSIAVLRGIGMELGFDVEVVEPLLGPGGEAVRSTAVRSAVSSGDMERASAMLGRSYSITGTVVHGDGRGGPLGFPTANLHMPAESLAPRDGIYACWVEIDGSRYMAAASIGERPTFPGAGRSIEAFVMDFDGDLYGRELRLELVRRLRDEEKFDSVEQLRLQVDRDVAETRRLLQASAAALHS